MITLGIDLSAEPTKTAYAVIGWSDRGARVQQLHVGAGNLELLPLIAQADKVGIDCPLGWPMDFLDFVIAHRDRTLPAGAGDRIPSRDRLAFRTTDRHLRQQGMGQPLSVSTDRIGRAAMRAAGLLAAIERQTGDQVDRAGSGRIVEVYPAAALKRWGLPAGGYKTDRARLCALVDEFSARTARWLRLDPTQRQLCEQSDDAFDAIVAALNARAAMLTNGVITPNGDTQAEAATIEGWIAVPARELDELSPRSH